MIKKSFHGQRLSKHLHDVVATESLVATMTQTPSVLVCACLNARTIICIYLHI